MREKVKDESVYSMLQAERDRCLLVIEKVSRELEKLPKGSLGQRKVTSHGKEYVYPCLRYREGTSVKFEHITPEQAEELKPLLERRKKLQADVRTNKKRIATLDAILPKDRA